VRFRVEDARAVIDRVARENVELVDGGEEPEASVLDGWVAERQMLMPRYVHSGL
jgi:hypothetical protein